MRIFASFVLALTVAGCVVRGNSAPAVVAGPSPGPEVVVPAGAMADGELATGSHVGCGAGQICNYECNGGGCAVDCAEGAVCNVECNGGGCQVACAGSATCNVECDGGGCALGCADGSTCNLQCEGGGCAPSCADGAVCNLSE